MWRLCLNMSNKGATVDLAIADLAGRQHGVVSTRQLTALGLDRADVSYRIRIGRLHRIHQGVCSVGHVPPSREARWMAAVLACGRSRVEEGPVLDAWGAALSHRSAACLWQLLKPSQGPVDVLIAGDGGRRRRRGIRLHRSRSLLPVEVTLRTGIPVTTPARTIADLHRASLGKARLISGRELRHVVRQADVLGLPIPEGVDRDGTRSDLERDFLSLCRVHRLPVPGVNVRVGKHLVDFLWRDRMLIVETDGYKYHRGRGAFEDDRVRGLDLRAQGFEVIRLAEKQIDEEPRRVGEVLAAALRVGADASRRA